MSTGKPTNTAILDVLAEQPTVRRALDDRAKQAVADREALRSRLVELEDQAEREYPKKQAKREQLLDAAKAAEAAHQAAVKALARWQAENSAASFAYTSARDAIIGELRAGANNVLIDRFIAELKDDIAATRKTVRTVERIRTNARTGRSSITIDSNGESVSARVLALNEALQQADGLQLVPDQSAVPEMIRQIRAGLPAVRMLVIDGDRGDAT